MASASALSVLGSGGEGGQGEDALGRVLGGDDDVARRVRGGNAGEDAGVDDEEVVGAVDPGVEVDDGGAAVAAVVDAHLVGAHPVVGAAVGPVDEHLDYTYCWLVDVYGKRAAR